MINKEKLKRLIIRRTAEFEMLNYGGHRLSESSLAKRIRVSIEEEMAPLHDAYARALGKIFSAAIGEKIHIKTENVNILNFACICYLKNKAGHNYGKNAPTLIWNNGISNMLRTDGMLGNTGDSNLDDMRPAVLSEIEYFIEDIPQNRLNSILVGYQEEINNFED